MFMSSIPLRMLQPCEHCCHSKHTRSQQRRCDDSVASRRLSERKEEGRWGSLERQKQSCCTTTATAESDTTSRTLQCSCRSLGYSFSACARNGGSAAQALRRPLTGCCCCCCVSCMAGTCLRWVNVTPRTLRFRIGARVSDLDGRKRRNVGPTRWCKERLVGRYAGRGARDFRLFGRQYERIGARSSLSGTTTACFFFILGVN